MRPAGRVSWVLVWSGEPPPRSPFQQVVPERVSVPRLPTESAPFRFPLLATIAPVVVSLAMFAATGSPFMLLFAALGPLTAAASYADSRFGARREARREHARFLADLDDVAQSVRVRHESELAERTEVVPGAPALLARRGADPYRWRADAAGPVLITPGTGSIPSSLELERPPAGAAIPVGLAEAIGELEALAATLADAPVAIDARLGVGVVGPRAPALALARALALQVAWSLSPADTACAWSGAGEDWLGMLPHRSGATLRREECTIVFSREHDSVWIATAVTPEALPGACRVVVRLGPQGEAEVVQHPDRAERRRFRPVFVSRVQATTWARSISGEAAAESLVAGAASIPSEVLLSSLEPCAGPGLAARFVVGAGGALELDLVRDGPHAVVGGTTGSGKSELLTSWVVAMAAAHSPQEVAFLLVDFKGGAAFSPLLELPHTVGIITDLDEAGAARALASLRAELRHRERELARVGARDIAEAPALGRLVIVVDEFAAMMAVDPELHALFADLAARGRSLGVHLVLCTQRPAGVVRDAVLANADLRVSLRVNNRADSDAVVGSPRAAQLDASNRGRAIVRVGGNEVELVQVALTAPADIAGAAQRWQAVPRPRRPWCEPLPQLVLPQHLGKTEGVAFGLLDLPEEQRRATADYVPRRDGHLLGLGGAGSGKSTLLRALAAHPGARWLPSRPAAAWDALDELIALLDDDVTLDAESVLLIDDLDVVLARFAADHHGAVLERVNRLLREGPHHGILVAASAQRVTADLQSLAALMPSRLVLRLPSRDEFLLAGAERVHWTPELPPGGGFWRGHRVQVALTDRIRAADPQALESPLGGERPLVVVTSRAHALCATLRERGFTPVLLGEQDPVSSPRDLMIGAGRAALVGDVDDWQSRWGALTGLRPVADVVFEGCAVADLRVLTRARALPPPLEPGQCWWWTEHGAVVRTRLP